MHQHRSKNVLRKRDAATLFDLLARTIDPKSELNWSTPLDLLIAVVLSAQTTDRAVNRVTATLWQDCRTAEDYLALGETRLRHYLRTIGLYRNKARAVIGLCRMLGERFHGEIPASRAELETLPGVGRKTANVVLNIVFGEPTLAVDTHVQRVSNRTGLVQTTHPRATEQALLTCVPQRHLRHAHNYLILLGRYTCKARKPECGRCPVRGVCRYPDKSPTPPGTPHPTWNPNDRGFKLLVLDVDGTLLRSDKSLAPRVRAALQALAPTGFPVTLASGRMFEAIHPYAQELELRTPLICNNGADLVESNSGERLWSLPLSAAAVVWLLERGRDAGLTTVLFSGPHVYACQHHDDHWLIERNGEEVEVQSESRLRAPDLEVQKLLFLDRTRPERLEQVRKSLLCEAAQAGITIAAQITESGILNFSHPNATKLDALRHLTTRLGIELTDVIAVGDGDNDAAVLEHAGLGIALKNARPAARRAARLIVPDNDHDGVAVAVETVVFPVLRATATAPEQR